MKLLHHPGELAAEGRRICIAIGMFDGIHLGHQQVIKQTLADARQHAGLAVVLTFDRHPSVVVAPARTPAMIYPLHKKIQLLEELGVEAALLISFDRAFSECPADVFIRQLTRAWPGLYSIAVGSGFTFGHRRGGNLALLNQMGQELHFVVHGLAPVALGGKTVSSTRIRAAIQQGQFDLAHQMLGRPWALVGTVVQGEQLGRSLGFPTANLDTSGLVLPPTGVYAGQALAQNRLLPCVVNIGTRPTLARPHPALLVEAHLLDYEGDLYGARLEIVFLAKLRDESRFASLDDLKHQIALDIQAARIWF
jgi:riboflavin kinase / FMN adenylyltransferase